MQKQETIAIYPPTGEIGWINLLAQEHETEHYQGSWYYELAVDISQGEVMINITWNGSWDYKRNTGWEIDPNDDHIICYAGYSYSSVELFLRRDGEMWIDLYENDKFVKTIYVIWD